MNSTNHKHLDRPQERGAVLIMVATAMVGILAFAAFVVDYGVMWSSRAQIQTAADAGALSGAISLAFDSPTDFAGARLKAQAVAQSNMVWGDAPDVLLTDVTFPACPPGAPGLPDTCVRVNAFRNQARSNPLPTYFGNLVGIADHGVVSTATAQIATGNATDCLKPWVVIDRWEEFGEPYSALSTFDKYSTGQGQAPPQENDIYHPPTATDPGSGFTLPADQGRRFAVKTTSEGPTANKAISSGWSMEIALPRADGDWGPSASVYEKNINSCGGLPYNIAEPGVACPANIDSTTAPYWATKGCFGIRPGQAIGPTRQGVEFITNLDSAATYVPGTGIVGSTFSPPTSSPRVVAIGVMDIDDYLSRNPTGSNGTVRLVNIYGFFIEGMGNVNDVTGEMTLAPGGHAVIGRLIKIPTVSSGLSPIPTTASFLVKIILVR